MEFKDFFAGADDKDRRLDKVLRIFISQTSLGSIYKYLRKGLIKVNGKKSSPEYRVCQGDKISIANFILEEKSDDEIKSESVNSQLPPVIFQNKHIIFFNKPSNLSVHGKDSLEEIYSNYYEKNLSNDSMSFKPGPLHRIDRMTSGIVAFSNSLEGAHWFTKAIKDHAITKTYVAIIQGTLEKTEKWIDYISAPDDSEKGFHVVKINNQQLSQDYKIAISTITPLAYGDFQNNPLTYAKIQIETGRQHQIRSQCSYHNHPLFGDTAYNGLKNPINNNFYLHAYELQIFENSIDLPQKINAPLPQDFNDFLLKTCDIKNTEL